MLPCQQARTLLVVFQRGRQIWSQGASLAAASDEVRCCVAFSVRSMMQTWSQGAWLQTWSQGASLAAASDEVRCCAALPGCSELLLM